MKLPNADRVLVEQQKIVDYLLNEAHRYGTSKARFFAEFGYRVEQWETLAESLRVHGQTHEVTKVRETGFGPRYEVEGELNAPDGRRPAGVHGLAVGSRSSCAATADRVPFGERMNIKEHDCVVLTADLPEEKLQAGDVGTVVHIHKGGEAFEVEFVTLGGQTVAVATVLPAQVRPVTRHDLSHVRSLVGPTAAAVHEKPAKYKLK